VVGVLLVFSLMVGPAAAAQRLTGRIGAGVALSAVLALGEAWGGLVLSYYSDWPASFCITAISAAVYFLTLAPGLTGRRGAEPHPQHSH
jgi:zinc/manganese transport system permease protein